MKLSIIIPAFDEEKTVGEILKRVNKVNLDGLEKEIILVDDGSKDKTYEIACSFKTKINSLCILRHEKNQGKGAAVQTGIKKADGDIIIIQDADLEYNPEDIPKIIKPIIQKEGDIVYGTRLKMKPVLFGKNKTPLLLHFFGNKFLSLITTVLYGYSVSDMETGYKAFNRIVLNGIKLKAKSFDFEPEITGKLLRKGYKILEVSIFVKPRGYDEGKKLHTFRDGTIALWTLLKYRFVN